jgi:hypothetical protein
VKPGSRSLALYSFACLSVPEVKRKLSTKELADLEGRGARSFGGVPLRWTDGAGRVHACEAVEASPNVLAAWTVCGRRLTTESSAYLEVRQVTCPLCRGALGPSIMHKPIES